MEQLILPQEDMVYLVVLVEEQQLLEQVFLEVQELNQLNQVNQVRTVLVVVVEIQVLVNLLLAVAEQVLLVQMLDQLVVLVVLEKHILLPMEQLQSITLVVVVDLSIKQALLGQVAKVVEEMVVHKMKIISLLVKVRLIKVEAAVALIEDLVQQVLVALVVKV